MKDLRYHPSQSSAQGSPAFCGLTVSSPPPLSARALLSSDNLTITLRNWKSPKMDGFGYGASERVRIIEAAVAAQRR